MLVKSFILLLALGAWGATLQFGARAAISNLSLWAGAAAHVLPPLILWTTWVAARWRASLQQQKQNELQASADAARRDEERAAARQRHDDELKQRRFHCDCRAVAITVAHLEKSLLTSDLPPNAEVGALDDDDPTFRDGTALQRLRPAITNALASVYSANPAAALLPIYVAPPGDAPGNEVLELIRAVHAELLLSQEHPASSALPVPPVRFLPAVDSASNSVLALFENMPDLPGAAILAFDSPLSRSPSGEDADLAEASRYPPQQTGGAPNEGAVALLVTHPDLPRMIEAVSGLEPVSLGNDAMTPFWERTPAPDGHASILVSMDAVQREELAALSVLGRIHRTTFAAAKSPRTGTLEMTRLFQGLLESAQIDAGLIDKPFTLEDAAADTSGKEPEQPRCGRLVHNAGNADSGGKRLAALGSAMLYFDIDFSPVDRDVTTNIVTCIGDLGCASSAAQLALNIVHAASSKTPALSAEFIGREGVAVSIAMPVPTPA